MNAEPSPSRRLMDLFLAMTALVAVWHIVATVLQNDLLPNPLQVFDVLRLEWANGNLLHHVGITLRRVAIAFFLAMSLGSLLGIIMGRYPRINRVLDPYLVLFLNIPALVLIILLYVWLGLVEAAAITAVVINKIPMVAVTLREGSKTLDAGLQEMASVFHLSRWTRIRHIVLPQLAPYFLVAARSGLALIWKIVLVVELLGRSDGVGFQLHLAFQMFDIAQILAYSLAFTAVVQILEWGILQPLDHHVSRWRRQAET